MLGLASDLQQPSFFIYGFRLDSRLPADHLLRKVKSQVNLDFVLPLVRDCYGLSGHVSLDPRLIVKMMILLFLYDIPSERELMEQIAVRLDFLWFLDFDLETPIPNHSVLSKARARWGAEVFKALFTQSIAQCVAADLVDGSLLHADSTMVKANASKDSVVSTAPELVRALRQAYEQFQSKLDSPAAEDQGAPAPAEPASAHQKPNGIPAAQRAEEASQEGQLQELQPTRPVSEVALAPADLAARSQPESASQRPSDTPAVAPAHDAFKRGELSESAPGAEATPRELDNPPQASGQEAKNKKPPVNSTRISVTDPAAQLSRSKNGLTELNYKDHRLVDDAHGVITAVEVTHGNVGDATQLPSLLQQHSLNTGLPVAGAAVAGDHHYGSAANYIYCTEEGIRPHLGSTSANLEEKGVLPLSRFVYEPESDRLTCPQAHSLGLHQQRTEEQVKIYLIDDPSHCAGCPLRSQCTTAKRGRSVKRHVQAEVIEAAQAEANSRAGRQSRKRRQHVMEGSFADAANNHGSKRARWRGLWRQQIQSYLIAAVQNWRILFKKASGGSGAERRAAAVVPMEAVVEGFLSGFAGQRSRAGLLWGLFGLA
jgi:transposase